MRALGLLGACFGLLLLTFTHVFAQNPAFAGDRSKFIRDVTFADGTVVKPGQKMTKEWEIENGGTVRWTNRQLKAVKSTAGAADLKAIKPVKVPNTAPGQRCRVKVVLTTPKSPGDYRVDFKMADAKGKILMPGQQPLYILVKVVK